jgi:hypothetical protein
MLASRFDAVTVASRDLLAVRNGFTATNPPVQAGECLLPALRAPSGCRYCRRRTPRLVL